MMNSKVKDNPNGYGEVLSISRELVIDNKINKMWKETKRRIRKDWRDGWNTWSIACEYYNNEDKG